MLISKAILSPDAQRISLQVIRTKSKLADRVKTASADAKRSSLPSRYPMDRVFHAVAVSRYVTSRRVASHRVVGGTLLVGIHVSTKYLNSLF